MKVSVETITPEIAAAVLAAIGRNRTLSLNLVAQLAGAMERGEFMGLNGETIKFDTKGNLEDGQHRLHAIVKCGIPQDLLVVRGVPEGAQETIDIGRARRFADMLHIRKERNAVTLAAATRMVFAYELTGVPHTPTSLSVQPTPQELFTCLERHPDIRQSVAANGRAILTLTGSKAAGLHYLFAAADPDDTEGFFGQLGSGDGLESGSPILALRERLIRALNTTDQMKEIVILAFTIRAFNAWRAGETLSKLQWRPGGARPDRFPAIDGCQIARRSRT